MRLKSVVLAAAVVGSFMVLSPAVADAQHRGGGQAVARPPAARPQVSRPQPARPNVGIRTGGGGMYRGATYYGSYGWGYPRWWFPIGYGPYWYGPYWYGSYWYFGDEDRGGSLKLNVKPKTADVFVDGYFAGRVDDFDGLFQSLDVVPGGHSLTLWCQGFKTVTQDVYVQQGNTLKLRYQLVPLAAGEPQDPRPVPPPAAQAGGARRDGSPPPDQPGQPNRPRAPRRPLPAGPREPSRPAAPAVAGETLDYAQLTIKVQPADAQVLIDGEAWQTSPGADRLVVHLPAGAHRVEIRKDGFKTFKTDVQIRVGEPATLNVSLSGQDGQ
jgi:hypothetical protein